MENALLHAQMVYSLILKPISVNIAIPLAKLVNIIRFMVVYHVLPHQSYLYLIQPQDIAKKSV
jgi:hypothetical protein